MRPGRSRDLILKAVASARRLCGFRMLRYPRMKYRKTPNSASHMDNGVQLLRCTNR